MLDNADPLNGWSLNDVLEFPVGSATNDVYGKLYNYLLDLLCNSTNNSPAGLCLSS